MTPSPSPPQTMFETYNFEGAFVQVQAVLTLYSQGLLSGLVLDSGDGVTHTVPVVEGYCFPHLTRRLDLAGRNVTAYLLDLLVRACTCARVGARVVPCWVAVRVAPAEKVCTWRPPAHRRGEATRSTAPPTLTPCVSSRSGFATWH